MQKYGDAFSKSSSIYQAGPLDKLRDHRLRMKFKKNVFLSALKIDFVLLNNADTDELQHYVAFHLGLHCLQKN